MQYPYQLDTAADSVTVFPARGPVTDHRRPRLAALLSDLTGLDHVWVTARANQPSNLDRTEWWLLTRILRIHQDSYRSARYQIELPDNTPGTRGHLTVAGSRTDLICLAEPRREADPYTIVRTYLHADPDWVFEQPDHTRSLLRALADSPHHDDTMPSRIRTVRDLDTGELTTALGPLLHLPSQAAHTLAGVLASTPRNSLPPVSEVHALAHALS